MPLRGQQKKASAPIAAKTLRGKVSWFGGPNDSTDSGKTALGLSTATPGIAVYDNSTLGGYWKVTTENGRTQVIRQTDIGPAPWTGRVVDITYSALSHFGYNEGNFPTDSFVTAVYLGKDKEAAKLKAGQSPVSQVAGEVEGKAEDAALLSGEAGEAIAEGFSIAKDLATGNYEDLGAKFALVGLQLVKDFAVGFLDLVIGPAWHWNQRTVSWYGKVVLDPRRYGDNSEDQWAFIWTAVFWGVGYVLLYTDPESGSLKAVPVHRSRFARHARRVQSLPARKSLIKPRHVKERTPAKPEPRASSAAVKTVTTMSTERPRTVRVTEHGNTGPAKSETAIKRVRIEKDGTIRRHPQPDKGNNARTGAHKGSGANPKGPAKPRTTGRRKP